jgi:transposase
VAEKIAKGIRIVGEQRDVLGSALTERYVAGESIRSIAEDIGRSYGFVHGVLRQSEAPLRARGGATRTSSEVQA